MVYLREDSWVVLPASAFTCRSPWKIRSLAEERVCVGQTVPRPHRESGGAGLSRSGCGPSGAPGVLCPLRLTSALGTGSHLRQDAVSRSPGTPGISCSSACGDWRESGAASWRTPGKEAHGGQIWRGRGESFPQALGRDGSHFSVGWRDGAKAGGDLSVRALRRSGAHSHPAEKRGTRLIFLATLGFLVR